MEHYNRNFNFHLYENQLTPFGKQVLKNLVRFYSREQHERREVFGTANRIKRVQNRKVLSFGTNYSNVTESSQINCPRHEIPNNFQNEELNFNILEENLIPINGTTNNAPENLQTSADLVTEITQELISHVTNVCPRNNKTPTLKDVDIETNNKKTNNNWDAVFDIDILTTDDMITQVDEQIDKPVNVDTKTTENNSNKNPTKRKNKHNTILHKKDAKKTKRDATELPPNFRKQPYTKVVKNWLENVNTEINDKSKTINYEIQIEKAPNKLSKKTIQSKLANKDGIMKFTKPNIDKDTETEVVTKCPENKVKKVKPKFTAPIKSQLAVKDIAYNVSEVNENLDERLFDVKNQTVTVVLFYGNGFCQLNRQYTDDSCLPVGVIVNFEDSFYVFKGKFDKKILEAILNNNKVNCYDGKDVLVYLINEDIECKSSNFIDVKIGSRLLDPENPPDNFSDVQKVLSFTPTYTVATECSLQKAAWYITLLNESVDYLVAALTKATLWNLFVDIEMKLLPIMAGMEQKGVKVDIIKLGSMEEILLNKMKEVELECHRAAGKSFQINSTVQVRAILYDELGLDTKCNVKIRETICKGAKSTSETMLRSLITVHPLPKLILEYRHLHKAHATFLTGIAQHVDNGVVRPTWVQTAAVTGRIASNNPNLQAIPKIPFSLVMFPEDPGKEGPVLSFRSVYISREGSSLVAADFKHIECRVFAHAAADTGLMEALKSQHDLFKVLAAKWLKKPESEVKSEDRERTKRIVYASLYGAGTRKLMDILNISYEETLAVTASFNRTFPALKSFGRSVVACCEQNGGKLSTICGRMRHFKNITSGDFALKSQAERQAVNFVVQGSAADVCKTAMVLTEARLRETFPPISARLLLQIHDELVWEVADHDVGRAATVIKEVMEDCGRHCSLSIPLPVSISIGKNWGEMTDYEF